MHNNIADFNTSLKDEQVQPLPSEHIDSPEDLGTAIQRLIQQLRKAPLSRS